MRLGFGRVTPLGGRAAPVRRWPARAAAHLLRPCAQVAARNAALNVAGGVKVDVFIRVRPHVTEDGDSPDVITVEGPEISLREKDGRSADVFKFDKVFPGACTNEELFTTAMQVRCGRKGGGRWLRCCDGVLRIARVRVQGIVDQVARGLSSCVFAYGQTGERDGVLRAQVAFRTLHALLPSPQGRARPSRCAETCPTTPANTV